MELLRLRDEGGVFEEFAEEFSRGMDFGVEGDYASAIPHLRKARELVDDVMRQDSDLASLLRVPDLKRVIEGFIVKAYVQRGIPTWTPREVEEIKEVAQGDLTTENKYLFGLMGAIGEWNKASSYAQYISQGELG